MVKGSASLSNAESLSIIIGNGIEGENSHDIATKIMQQCLDNLCEFWYLGVSMVIMVKIKGDMIFKNVLKIKT